MESPFGQAMGWLAKAGGLGWVRCDFFVFSLQLVNNGWIDFYSKYVGGDWNMTCIFPVGNFIIPRGRYTTNQYRCNMV